MLHSQNLVRKLTSFGLLPSFLQFFLPLSSPIQHHPKILLSEIRVTHK